MDGLTNAAEVKEEHERDHADRANGIKSARDYVNAGHERPWWNQGSIADKDELERFKAAPRPPKKTTVVIELDDVVRATARSILDALKLDEVGMKDLESRFLFHCKGFGTPTSRSLAHALVPFPPLMAPTYTASNESTTVKLAGPETEHQLTPRCHQPTG